MSRAEHHLEKALQENDPPDKDFHIRAALQQLSVESHELD